MKDSDLNLIAEFLGESKKSSKRFKEITPKAVDEFVSWISNTPGVQPEDLMKKAIEMGYSPTSLIDTSLGVVKYEKSGAKLSSPTEDILNEIFQKDPTPGKRYVMDPTEAITKKGKEVASALEGNVGVASSLNLGKARFLPEYVAVKQPYTDLDKLRSIAHAGHELKHSSDSLTRPNFKMQNEKPYKKGHHFKEIYEPTELVKEVKELASDPKLEKEILKQSKKSGIKASPFTKLRSLLGFLPSLAAAGIAAYSPQSKAAQVPSKVLEEGDPMSFIFPSEAGEGEEEEIRKMYEEAKKRKIE